MSDKGPEPDESLSATGMFLRALQSAPPQQAAQDQTETPAQAAHRAESCPSEPFRFEPVQTAPPPPPANAEPGEFTRMFRAMPAPAPPSAAPLPQSIPPPSAPPLSIAPQPLPAQPLPPASTAGGEFTRAFVVPPSPNVPPPPLASPQATSPKSQGFSTPGLSDSVSAEGSFTRVSRPVSSPAPAPEAAYPTLPASGGFASSVWPSEPAPSQAQPTAPAPSSFTAIFTALSSGSEPSPLPHSSYPEPLPIAGTTPYPPAPPPAPNRPPQAIPPGGGVTQLINLLSEGPSAATTAPLPLPAAPFPAQRPPAPADEEFFRITQRPQSAPSAAASASPPPPPAAIQAPAAVPLPVIPSIKPPAMPKLQVKAPSVPAPPRTKLQEMLPLLLVANAFLVLILIVLVTFMLHRK